MLPGFLVGGFINLSIDSVQSEGGGGGGGVGGGETAGGWTGTDCLWHSQSCGQYTVTSTGADSLDKEMQH